MTTIQIHPSKHDVNVVRGVTWTANHVWDAESTRVVGELSTGETVGLANQCDMATPASERSTALHEWLHGRVLEVYIDGQAAPLLVVPGNHMDAGVIREALVRRRYGAVAKAA